MKPREPRRKVLIQARMRVEGQWTDACIRDISSRGLLVQAAVAPERGRYIEIFKADHVIVGRVVWNKDRRFGVQTQDRLNIEALMQQVPAANSNTPGPTYERRTCPRPAPGIAEMAERSQRFSAAFQFATIGLCAAAAAAAGVGLISESLANPLARVSSHLLR